MLEAYYENFRFCWHAIKTMRKFSPRLVGFSDGKSLIDYLVRTMLIKIDNNGGFESYGKGTCQASHFIGRTNSCTTKVFGKPFKIHCRLLNYNSEKHYPPFKV